MTTQREREMSASACTRSMPGLHCQGRLAWLRAIVFSDDYQALFYLFRVLLGKEMLSRSTKTSSFKRRQRRQAVLYSRQCSSSLLIPLYVYAGPFLLSISVFYF